MNTSMQIQPITQYDYNFIMNIRNKTSKRLPENIYKKIISYQSSRFNHRRPRTVNRFLLSRNPNSVPFEELLTNIKKMMTSLLNKVTVNNLDKMRAEINKIVDKMNEIDRHNQLTAYQNLMHILLKKAIQEKSFSKLYATILQDMSIKIKYFDYAEYLDNLFINMRKLNDKKKLSNNYDTFCKQLKDKTRFVNLFIFIGELYQCKMLETVLIKKYIMILFDNIIKSKDYHSLELETNAHCIKNLLLKCNNEKFYDIVYSKFKVIQKEKQYKAKFRFTIMDINEYYEKNYLTKIE